MDYDREMSTPPTVQFGLWHIYLYLNASALCIHQQQQCIIQSLTENMKQDKTYHCGFAEEFSQCNTVEWFVFLNGSLISQITYKQQVSTSPETIAYTACNTQC